MLSLVFLFGERRGGGGAPVAPSPLASGLSEGWDPPAHTEVTESALARGENTA